MRFKILSAWFDDLDPTDPMRPAVIVHVFGSDSHRYYEAIVRQYALGLGPLPKGSTEVLRRSLHDTWFVDTAACAEEALAFVKRNCYHAIIVDDELHDKSGIWLLSKLKNLSPLTRRCMHATTAPRELDLHLADGVIQHFWMKPVSPREISTTLIPSRGSK